LRPFRGTEATEPLPIIDPGHIEFSEPQEVVDMPNAAEGAPMVPAESAAMANFAAAAEVLVQRQSDERNRPTSENNPA
jgi:hypothetical protein